MLHCGYSCLVPRVDVQHLVNCVKLTFSEEEKERQKVSQSTPTRIIEALVMGTIQFRSAVVESTQRLNSSASDATSQVSSLIPRNCPSSKTAQSWRSVGMHGSFGIGSINFQEVLSKSRRREARKNRDASESTSIEAVTSDCTPRERVMIFLADGRFHLEAAMISRNDMTH